MLQKEKKTYNLHQILTKLTLTPMKNLGMQTTPRAHDLAHNMRLSSKKENK